MWVTIIVSAIIASVFIASAVFIASTLAPSLHFISQRESAIANVQTQYMFARSFCSIHRAAFFGGFGGSGPFFALAFVAETLGICLYTASGETRSPQLTDASHRYLCACVSACVCVCACVHIEVDQGSFTLHSLSNSLNKHLYLCVRV